MNYNNLAQKTNFIAGSNEFKKIPFYLTNVNIPGINFGHPEVGGRQSVKIKLNSDNITYNTLSLEMLIDEDFLIYKEIMDIILTHVNIEEGTFKDFAFDFWVEVSNNQGNKVMKLDFANCRILSIGDIQFDTQDDNTEHTLSMELSFDYYNFDVTKILIQREP